MDETIFDVIREREEIPDGQEGFFEIAKRMPDPKDDSYFQTAKKYGKTILKGISEGLTKFGGIMGPLEDIRGRPRAEIQKEHTEQLEELLPGEEGYIQKSIRRGLGEAPTMLSFPGSQLSTLPRVMLAGFIGEGAKELGAPEWAQTAAELTAYIGPDITKKLLMSGEEKGIIEAGRKFGLTDEQITPLIQSDFKKKWLSKLIPRRGETERALQSTKEALSEGYSGLGKTEAAGKEITEVANGKLINSVSEKLSEMPRDVQNKIIPDLDDLLNNKITPRALMNFYKDINSKMTGSSKELAHIKGAVKDAIKSIDPKLAEDFGIINDLYSKYYNISSLLKPNMTSDIIRAGEAMTAITAIPAAFFGHYAPLVAIVGEQAVRKVSQKLLLNPHYQQLGKKMANALNENKFGIALKLSKSMSNLIRKDSPELADELVKLSIEDFEKAFSQSER